ncbi:MAG: CPXCG motif-containing cysteine-rich protein [Mariprofundaceae bacterium]|nr:CPXCG motif-containing cysteine-rich protein [Mariprofundaceae bacterium]
MATVICLSIQITKQMDALEYITMLCPYCGEKIDLTIERTGEEESYTEDCQVCCCPMHVRVMPAGNDIEVFICRENESL